MEKPKKIIIKIHNDRQVEIIRKDEGVLIVLQYPDDSEIELHEGDKKTWESGKGDGGRWVG